MYLRHIVVDGFRAATAEPLECELPGRFAVLLGANSTGKSTVTDAIALGHQVVFPWKPRASSAALTRARPRTIDLAYKYEEAETLEIWSGRQAQGVPAPAWTRRLSSSMGSVRTEVDPATSPEAREVFANLPVLYLSSMRNPVIDLAGRDARLIVEMLRSEAKRPGQTASLAGLRKHMGNLLGKIVGDTGNPLVRHTEARVNTAFEDLTSGVSKRSAFLATTDVDDAFLARVFEFYVGLATLDRTVAHRLEVEGLGYANMLQIAVVLAAIPNLTDHSAPADGLDPIDTEGAEEGADPQVEGAPQNTDDTASPEDDALEDRTEAQRREELAQAEDAAASAEDSIFRDQFNACVVLEEPEAHLHPQLQHSLIRYLKKVVDARPELQFILTTHSDEIVAACDPDDLVIFRRAGISSPSVRTVANLGLTNTQRTLARRHLDVSRSSSLFGDRIVVVEGITDAQLLRAFGRVWASNDADRERFLDALTVTVIGSRVGEWLPAMLVAPGQEVSTKVCVLMDSDGKPLPAWVAARIGSTFNVFINEPTLEPAMFEANPVLCIGVLSDLGFAYDPPTKATVIEWFKESGRRHKALFADSLAGKVRTALKAGVAVATPPHFKDLLDFIYDAHDQSPADLDAEGDGAAAEWAGPGEASGIAHTGEAEDDATAGA